MPEIGTSGSMSGDGKRGVGHGPQVTAPILDSTGSNLPTEESNVCSLGEPDAPWTPAPSESPATYLNRSAFELAFTVNARI
jgi:hypothetical protein